MASSRSSIRSSRSPKSESSSVIWVIVGLLVVAILLMIFMSNYKYFEKFTNASKGTLQYFYMDGCGHCEDFNNEWKKIETTIAANQDKYTITTEKIDIKNSKLASDLTINGVPTISLVLANKDRTYYSGDRKEAAVLKYVEEKLKSLDAKVAN